MINIHQNLLSEEDLLFLDSISSNFVETQIPHNNNNYVRKSLNIKEELLEYQKRCSKYLPDEYKLSGLWINKVTNETNVDDVFHNDAADLTIITYINEDFEGGEFEYFFKNQKIKIIPKINYSIILNKKIKHRVLNVINGYRFSLISFYTIIEKLSKLVQGQKGTATAFIYSNLVKAGGMELFAEALKINGYLEYMDNESQYNINNNTIDSRTGKTYGEFKKNKMNMSDFHPATYILITGSVDDSGEDIPEIKQKQIRQVFNNIENKEGKLIKFVLGSRVMNEGITLENTREVHILDVHYNLGKVDQVIGRAIRMCKHMSLVSDKNPFPQVNVYRYVVGIKNKLSTDETLYQKAESKFILVKLINIIHNNLNHLFGIFRT